MVNPTAPALTNNRPFTKFGKAAFLVVSLTGLLWFFLLALDPFSLLALAIAPWSSPQPIQWWLDLSQETRAYWSLSWQFVLASVVWLAIVVLQSKVIFKADLKLLRGTLRKLLIFQAIYFVGLYLLTVLSDPENNQTLHLFDFIVITGIAAMVVCGSKTKRWKLRVLWLAAAYLSIFLLATPPNFQISFTEAFLMFASLIALGYPTLLVWRASASGIPSPPVSAAPSALAALLRHQ